MKATELRIGNKVGLNGKSPVLTTDTAILKYLEETGDDDKYQPIPLTEEWLEKFGFKKNKSNEWHIECEKQYCYLVFESDMSAGIYDNEHNFSRGINSCLNSKSTRHVHQLQNLYFALTGEELVIKQSNEVVK